MSHLYLIEANDKNIEKYIKNDIGILCFNLTSGIKVQVQCIKCYNIYNSIDDMCYKTEQNSIYACTCGISFGYDEYRKYLYTRLHPDKILIDKYIDGCVPITVKDRSMKILLYESASPQLTQFNMIENKDIELWFRYKTYSTNELCDLLSGSMYGFPTIFISMDIIIDANSCTDTIIYTH